MTPFQRHFITATIFLASLVFVRAAAQQDPASTARRVRAAYASAQTEWQRGLAQLVIDSRAEFTAVATAQRDLQIALIELSNARFDYLLDHEPSRIVLNEGLSKFANFDWTDADSAALRAAAAGYAALEDRAERLRAANDSQPDWPAFREYFRAELAASDAYQALFNEFTRKTRAAEALLPTASD